MNDRERGRKIKVAGNANVVKRVGYTVYVGFERKNTCLLTARNECPGLLSSFVNQQE